MMATPTHDTDNSRFSQISSAPLKANARPSNKAKYFLLDVELRGPTIRTTLSLLNAIGVFSKFQRNFDKFDQTFFKKRAPPIKLSFRVMQRARRVNVYLNVYELLSFDKYNGYLVPVGLGAYHSGVEIYGEEFSFGFHDSDHSGVFTVDPRSAPDCKFVETVYVGETELTYAQVKRIVEEMGADFKGTSYNVFLNNCNHFTKAFVSRLTGQGTPSYLNRLAALGNVFKCFLPFDSNGQMDVQAPTAMAEAGPGHRLTDDALIVPLDDDDKDQRRSLLAAAASKRSGLP